MADNFLSYSRFTALPPNISSFGGTVEEVQLQQGKPDPNPVLSPMPETRVAEARLSLGASGSDRLRLALPLQPDVNPYEGAKSTLSMSRSAVKKLSGSVVSDLESVVQAGEGFDPNLQSLMQDSLRRVVGLSEYMGQLNQLTEQIQVRSLAASKG
jgi:hypothetical protein